MNDDVRKNLLKLRLSVGFLGERAQFGWWPTAFFESSSQLFLEPVFTKTSNLAQYQGVIEAARRLHDDHLNVGSYHLFRLPEEVEHSLHTMAQSPFVGDITNSVASKQSALEVLKSFAKPIISYSREGPIVIGRIEDLYSVQFFESTAGSYLWSFEQNKKAYPYLTR
jgi:hypothetical protein